MAPQGIKKGGQLNEVTYQLPFTSEPVPVRDGEFGLAMVDAVRALAVGEGGMTLVDQQGNGPELEALVPVSTLLLPA